MAEAKTKPGNADVPALIAALTPPARRARAEQVAAIMARVSGAPAVLWGPSMIGYGQYDYRYDSGRTGTMFRIGFAPRAAELVVYIIDGFPAYADLLAKLGKVRTGKSCLYIRYTAPLDDAVLEQLVAASWAEMARRYPG